MAQNPAVPDPNDRDAIEAEQDADEKYRRAVDEDLEDEDEDDEWEVDEDDEG